MPNPANIPSSAFNVERARAAMLDGLEVPRDFLQKAVDANYRQLDAKKTQFFTHQGMVVDERTVEDNTAQLTAIDKVYSIAGVYVREKDVAPAQPQVTLEMDSQTGIVRLVVGGLGLPQPKEALSSVTPRDDASIPLELPPMLEPGIELPPVISGLASTALEEAPKVIKVKRGNLPVDVHKALFGEE